MNVEIAADATLFPEKEYISGIYVAVWVLASLFIPLSAIFLQVKPRPLQMAVHTETQKLLS